MPHDNQSRRRTRRKGRRKEGKAEKGIDEKDDYDYYVLVNGSIANVNILHVYPNNHYVNTSLKYKGMRLSLLRTNLIALVTSRCCSNWLITKRGFTYFTGDTTMRHVVMSSLQLFRDEMALLKCNTQRVHDN